jgi:hypothetical protein
MGQPDRRPEVDVDDPVELRQGHLIEPSSQRHTSVVDQQPDPRMLAQYRVGHLRGCLAVSEIHHVGVDAQRGIAAADSCRHTR